MSTTQIIAGVVLSLACAIVGGLALFGLDERWRGR